MVYKFLIYISYSYALPIGRPLEKEIRSRGDDVVWFADEKDGQQALAEKTNVLNTIKEVITYKPHVVLTITNNVPDFITGLKVQIFHGFNAEKRPSQKDGFSHFRIRGFFDLYCTQGPSTTIPFKEKQQKHPYFEVIETGWSKMDPLFPLEENPKTTDKPTVLISSTFTERLSLAFKNEIFEKIKSMAGTGNYRFLVVLHPKMPPAVKAHWKTLENENLTYFDTTDLIPLFKQADFMFADTTSAIQEFGLQGKPTVAYAHTFPKPYLININTVDEIEPAFQKALNPPKEILEKLATYNGKLHPYYDGQSSKRVVEACIKVLHEDKRHLKSKPLNIVRKIKIRNQLWFYTPRSYNRPYTLSKPRVEHDQKPLTAIIPTYNEAHNIEAVIASVDFADEIFVIDSFSTDGTYEKACQLADKVLQREFRYYADQKNWAIKKAENEWILLVDADERVPAALKHEILDILRTPGPDDHVAYWIGRKNHFMGRHVKHSGWRNDKVIRLFKRDYCEYEDKYVHEEIIANGKVGALQNKLSHNTYTTLDDYLRKMDHYAWLQARDYDKKTGRLNVFHFFLKPFWRFFKHYIIQGGFRDGVVGLTISYIQGYSVFMRYAKLWLIRRNRR